MSYEWKPPLQSSCVSDETPALPLLSLIKGHEKIPVWFILSPSQPHCPRHCVWLGLLHDSALRWGWFLSETYSHPSGLNISGPLLSMLSSESSLLTSTPNKWLHFCFTLQDWLRPKFLLQHWFIWMCLLVHCYLFHTFEDSCLLIVCLSSLKLFLIFARQLTAFSSFKFYYKQSTKKKHTCIWTFK